MKNLLVLTLFAVAIIAPGYCEESSNDGNSFMSVFNRFKRLLSGGEPVKPNRYVEIDFAEGREQPAVKIIRLDAMEKSSGESRGERLLKAPIVRASRHEVPQPEAVQKDLELGFIGPVVMSAEETKKTLKNSQYPGERHRYHYDDDDEYYDDDDDDDEYYGDDDDDDDDYDFPRDASKNVDPSVLTMSRKLAEMQRKRAYHEEKPKTEASNEDADADDDEKNFAETHHLNSGEVYYHYRHHSHVYDEDDFKCPVHKNGVYINLNHCKRYYICRAGRKTIIACHHGFSYDTRSRRCLPESISRC